MGYLTAYALKDGKALWRFQSGKRIVGTPAVSEGIVVFGSADCKIYGLNAQNGNLLWIVKASEPVLGAVTIDNGTVYRRQRPYLSCHQHQQRRDKVDFYRCKGLH